MAYQLPEKLQNLVPYSPLEGDYPIRLDANESFLSPPPELLQQIGDAVARIPFNRYPDPYCVALCEKFASFFGGPSIQRGSRERLRRIDRIDCLFVCRGGGSDGGR